MCVPGAAQIVAPVVNSALSLTKTVIDVKQEQKNNEYRSQIALNNIKAAENEAKRQTQLGIDKSREEKVEGIKKANILLAQNASSGLDISSETALDNYADVLNQSYYDAANIQNQYNLKADSYYQKANNYLTNYTISQQKYKSNLYKTAINALYDYPKVNVDWGVIVD